MSFNIGYTRNISSCSQKRLGIFDKLKNLLGIWTPKSDNQYKPETHLQQGDKEPPKTPGLLRLYSMQYCPYAQRSRLVLKAKEIPHEIVNINLQNRPDWFYKINPSGLVPALVDGEKIILESLEICEYLENKFPNKNPLYPSNHAFKQKDTELIKLIEKPIGIWVKCLISEEKKSAKEWAQEFVTSLKEFEDELRNRKTTFYTGDKPGMLDFMLWPWVERMEVIDIKLNEKLPITDDQLPNIFKWKKAMLDQPIVAEMFRPPERYWKVMQPKIEKIKERKQQPQPLTCPIPTKPKSKAKL